MLMVQGEENFIYFLERCQVKLNDDEPTKEKYTQFKH